MCAISTIFTFFAMDIFCKICVFWIDTNMPSLKIWWKWIDRYKCYYGWIQIWILLMDTNMFNMIPLHQIFELSRANKREQASCSTSEADMSYLTFGILFSYLKYLLNICQNICSTPYRNFSSTITLIFYLTFFAFSWKHCSLLNKSSYFIDLIWDGFYILSVLTLCPVSTSLTLWKKQD